MFGDAIQRWSCPKCFYKFSDPGDVENARKAFQQAQTIESMKLKSDSGISSTRQICVENNKETKNLVADQITTSVVPQKREFDPDKRQKIKGAIIDFVWYLQKNAYSEDTYRPYGENLEFLVKNGADLFNPENAKEVVAKLNKTDIRKWNLIKAYKCFMEYAGLKAEMPIYKYIRNLPFIPLETEIDQLIAGCGALSKQMPIFLQLLKETGMRAGEAYRLTWGDIDDVAKNVSVRPEKGSNPRILKISEKLLLLLCSQKTSAIPDPKQKVFRWKRKIYIGRAFRKMRARAVQNTGNQRLLKIHFHTLRYWKGTRTYIQTKSLAHVMVILGHKSWSSAQLYVGLAEATAAGSEEYVTAVATTLDQALKLIESGFEYVHDWENAKVYRKLKT